MRIALAIAVIIITWGLPSQSDATLRIADGTPPPKPQVRPLEHGTISAMVAQGMNFQSNATFVSGDSYAQVSIVYQSDKVPQCSAAATTTNLPSPQVLAGTTITWMAPQPGCGSMGASGFFPGDDCASDTSLSEVAPTACEGAGGRFQNLPYHFHPMVPVAMPQEDFIAALTAALPPLIRLAQATQNRTGVIYPTPEAYPKPYANKVMLIIAREQFCVTARPASVVPAIGGACPSRGAHRYGDSSGATIRYIDWGLITADTSGGRPTTFFQEPKCAAPCPFQGLQNGIRYIPMPPAIDVHAIACETHFKPGVNVVNTIDGSLLPCPRNITLHKTTVETFVGTKYNPESLIILNPNPPIGTVTIRGVLVPGRIPGSCRPSLFDAFHWGQILSTGDIIFDSPFVFVGFLYAKGTIVFNSDAAIWGRVYSLSYSSYSTLNSTVTFCGGEIP